MEITRDIKYVGVNDHEVDLFEGQYVVPNGMAYNSYVVLDEKVTVFDTVDAHFTHQWLDNLESVFEGRKPDYLIIQHMEPDHAGSIAAFMQAYKDTTIVSSEKAFAMMGQFFGDDFEDRRMVVKEGDSLTTGGHTFAFVAAPMVHWPEVIVTYDITDKVLFSADGFGKFGALDVEEDWDCEARRYYIGIVGKYGAQVQSLLKKAAGLDIQVICPTHGPVLKENLGHYIKKYDLWSSYTPESEGIVIAYTSVYGNTKRAVESFAEKLRQKGCPKVAVHDLARTDMAEAVEDAFRYNKLVLATTTYNAEIFPYMREFITHLTERNFQNRTVALIENGSWAPMAARVMKGMLEKSKKLTMAEPVVTIRSALNAESSEKLEALATNLCQDYLARQDDTADKHDLTALFNIGYGLYVITSNDGKKDNGLIVNTVTQVTNTPNRIAVCINKDNYSHHVIKQTGKMNINCLSQDAPFSIFQNFGFQSGRSADKFAGQEILRSDNGLAFLPMYINSFMSLKVEQYVDLDTHGMFICSVTESRVISHVETMTYTYYQNNVKPKPETEGKKGWVCKVCGYVYEGDELPDDFVCPLCKHGPADFERIE
ncbi:MULTISPECIES: flavin reductase [unclassified Acutalibacter]|jgi:flavorubredoxin/flavin reductase (DIM6/NTAB) family NADH-FMN oxidoreductase RutF|uniref:flavin reductase n=1 Tax=unclassified Acutalibacter TaxID=2620728 RepID=UPI001412E895|nr:MULTISPECIES: flavin reductase [unclassified Acutalibacter]MCI9224009.1 MBL fold metallo-hydrolase [Acutalibacter sp.]NBJ88817.1 MBL fold metallo-hydrolase [Acutalibacter sp. 1XD8-36]